MQTLELLSPAKNLECGISAIDHGADAVYIGANRFGARVAAGNSIEDIKTLCDYAHRFDAKVFVTVNTIIYDEELPDTVKLCQQLQEIGVDAILLQDFGLLTSLPALDTLRIHASTQTDNRTIEKVRWLHSLGFKRVVLARELSISEIAAIHKAVPEVELEVFVHGALCVSYSGQCYASEYCFSRSANRGACAQFCRMPFNLTDADGKRMLEQSHLLSLRDMTQLDNLERLAEAGAVSFKIEGRLKDADYVKNITAAYSERLNEICHRHPDKYRRASMGRCTYTFTPDINKSFNRGFTTYFADGRQPDMVSFNTPKALGEKVGKVKELRQGSFNIATTMAFSNGDGLCFFSPDHRLIGFRVNRAEGNRLFPLQMPRELRPGVTLYRNHDQAFQTLLGKASAKRKVSLTMRCTISHDTITLQVTDEHRHTATASTPYEYQKAQKPQDENIHRQLTKLGDTMYVCTDLQTECQSDSPFIPSSLLAQLRRKAMNELRSVGGCGSEGYRSEGCGLKVLGRIDHEALRPKTNKQKPITERSNHKTDQQPTTNNLQTEFTELTDQQPKSATTNNPKPPIPYLYNAANRKAKAFYSSQGIDDARSFEKDRTAADTLLMQCRYCLRNELGYCTKSGRKAPWHEPLTISLDDGRSFTLRFNCKECQMEIYTH